MSKVALRPVSWHSTLDPTNTRMLEMMGMCSKLAYYQRWHRVLRRQPLKAFTSQDGLARRDWRCHVLQSMEDLKLSSILVAASSLDIGPSNHPKPHFPQVLGHSQRMPKDWLMEWRWRNIPRLRSACLKLGSSPRAPSRSGKLSVTSNQHATKTAVTVA